MIHAKQYTTDAFKTTSKRAIQKTVEATGVFVGNIIANRTTKVSRTSPQNNSVTNEEEVLRERYNLQKKDRKLLMI